MMTQRQMAKEAGISYGTLRSRISRKGWSVEQAVSVPVGQRPTADAVVAAFDADPTQTSYEIGEALGLDANYVRSTLRRRGRKLMRTRGQRRNHVQ